MRSIDGLGFELSTASDPYTSRACVILCRLFDGVNRRGKSATIEVLVFLELSFESSVIVTIDALELA